MENPHPEIDLALCRSALYEALAIGFRPPLPEMMRRLLDDHNNEALWGIASIIDSVTPAETDSLASLVRKLTECSGPASLDSLENRHRRLFGHTAHAKVPPYETEYGEHSLFQQPQQLGDIAGFFAAFGLKLKVSEHERSDHISCECEFLSFLSRKEAYALQQADESMLEATRHGQKLFLRDHLARFAHAFVNLLNREDGQGFYGTLGQLCLAFLKSECDRFRIPLGPELLPLRPSAPVDECFTCGSGEELVQILRSPSATQSR